MPDDITCLEEQAKEWVRKNKRVIIDKVDNFIKIDYTKEDLNELLM